MKLFKYNQFINESKKYIDSICKKYGIKNYTINEDGTVDVDDDVDIYDKNLTRIPLKFGKVTGDFDCAYNDLTSLEGCPYEVGGTFNCPDNDLTSLEGGPQKVDKHFICCDNKLTSLKGSPKEVGGGFNCSDNFLISLEGCTELISSFGCTNNQLVDVKGFPKIAYSPQEKNFYILGNPVYEIFKLIQKIIG